MGRERRKRRGKGRDGEKGEERKRRRRRERPTNQPSMVIHTESTVSKLNYAELNLFF